MSTTDPGRTVTDQSDLRSALIDFVSSRFWRLPGQAAEHVDAMMAGPLKDLIAVRDERDRARADEEQAWRDKEDAIIAVSIRALATEANLIDLAKMYGEACTELQTLRVECRDLTEELNADLDRGLALKCAVSAAEAEAASLRSDLLRARERIETLEWHLGECINQLEYQHEKFGGTGSGDTVMFRALAQLAQEASQ